jgi:hypothetical protein
MGPDRLLLDCHSLKEAVPAKVTAEDALDLRSLA